MVVRVLAAIYYHILIIEDSKNFDNHDVRFVAAATTSTIIVNQLSLQ